jgi:uncharacterized protein YndB with AHSA1/START domain
MSSSARAVADPVEGVILARVDIEAPPERVFRALTTEEVTEWWGSPELYRTTRFTMDLRPGGKWRSEGVSANGEPFSVGGEVLAVEAPHMLVQTWQPDWDPGEPTTLHFRLEPTAAGTRVTLRHTGFAGRAASCEGHANGWERVFGLLAGHVAPKVARKTFFVRLVAPRPTFMMDMTAEEREVMRAHGAYWREKLAAGSAIAFGPVADPQGGWGLGVVQAADEAEMRAFEAGDPVIESGRGFRYEVLPMPAGVVH